MKRLLSFLCLSVLFFTLNGYAQQNEYVFYSRQAIVDSVIKAEYAGELEKAIEWIDKLDENDSMYVALQTSKVSYLLDLEKYNEAIEICDKFLHSDQEYSYFFYLNKGVALLRLARQDDEDNPDPKKLNKAVQVFTQAIEEFPYQHMLYFNRGVAYNEMKKYGQAAGDFKKCIDINPFYASAHFQLGLLAYRAHNLAEAMLCFNAYLYNNPTSETSLNVLSWLNTNVAAANKEEKIKVQISKDDKAFDEINLLLENYVALQKKYKVKNKIKLNIVKQNHLLFEQLQNFEGNGGFFSRKYVPFFKKIFQEGYFDAYTYYTMQSLQDGSKYKKIVEANKAKIKEFINWSIPEFYNYFARHQLTENGKTREVYYFIENSKYLSAIGDMDIQSRVKNGKWQYFYSGGHLKAEGFYDENGERTGVWKWYYQNGQVEEILEFKDGKFNGADTIFYENGNLKLIAHYKDGKKEGDYFEYTMYGGLVEHSIFKDGKANGHTKLNYDLGEGFLHYEATQEEGKIEGELLEYYDSGEKRSVMNFTDNQKQGESITYYRNGQIYSKANYVDGQLEGDYISYYRNGKIYKQGKYKEGATIGEWKTYYRNGTLQYVENYDEKGKLNGHLVAYDYDGKIHYEYDYLKGDLVAYKYYDKQGNIIKESKKSKGKFWFEGYYPHGVKRTEGYYKYQGGQTGEWKYYTKDGVLESIENYKDGKVDGEVKVFYSNGALQKVVQYKDGERDGYYTEYYINGKISQQGYYLKGKAQGTWYSYYIDGSLKVKSYVDKGLTQGNLYRYAPDNKIANISIYKDDKELAYIYFDTNGKPIDTLWFDDKQTEKNIYYQKLELANYNDKTKLPVEKKGSYLNGYAHGKSTWYYYDQTVRTKGEHFNDERHGKWIWYYFNGKVETEGSYYYGDKHGEWKNYYDNGQLETVEHYELGELTGHETGYNENGTKSYELDYFEDMKHGEQRFYSDKGELQLVRYYQYGILQGYSYPGKDGKLVPMIPVNQASYVVTGYYPNGKKSREYSVTNGQFDGKYMKYASNGTILEDETYENGYLVGVAKEFYGNGKLKREANYIYGHLDGVEKQYYSNGQLKSEIPYKNGERHGKAVYYNKSGKKIRETLYFNDSIADEKVF